MIKIDAPMRSTSALLERIAKETKKDVKETIRSYARLLAVDLAFRTQPYGKGKSSRDKGEGAIVRDILGGRKRRGILVAMDDAMIAAAIETGAYSTGRIRLFVRKDGTVYGTDQQHFRPDASYEEIRQIHRSAFQNGRMTQAGGRTRDIGRWKFIEQLVTKKTTAERYIKAIQKRVGWAKAGWATCARLLGGTRGIPQWVTRHRKAPGRITDNTADRNPSVTLHNDVPYSREVLHRNAMSQAQRNVAKNIEKRLAMILKSKLKK